MHPRRFQLMEGYVQGALRKELSIAPFVECFKTTTLGMFHLYLLSIPRSTKGTTHSHLLWSILKQLYWESLPDKFYQYLAQLTQAIHFCRLYVDIELCTRSSVKEAMRCFFHRPLWNKNFGKSPVITFIDTSYKMLKHYWHSADSELCIRSSTKVARGWFLLTLRW